MDEIASSSIHRHTHAVYPKDTPMTNLYITLLDKVGVRTESLGDSTGALEVTGL
jgi:hypothetical protein